MHVTKKEAETARNIQALVAGKLHRLQHDITKVMEEIGTIEPNFRDTIRSHRAEMVAFFNHLMTASGAVLDARHAERVRLENVGAECDFDVAIQADDSITCVQLGDHDAERTFAAAEAEAAINWMREKFSAAWTK